MQTGGNMPLGATTDAGGVNFAVSAPDAERIELCLFDASGNEIGRHSMPECDGGIWHGFLPGAAPGLCYGYRAYGRHDPEAGFFFNPSKLLLDPYARQLAGNFRWHESVFDRSPADSAPHVHHGVVRNPGAPLPRTAAKPWADTVIYEANLRGFTMRHPAIEDAKKGRFAALTCGEILDYLRALGITAVELQPVHAFVDEWHLARKGLRNFWGYNPLSFFAPMPRYAGDDPVAEFREMANAIHDAGLELILDVVYNHTAEGGREGPTLCLRGLDNHGYYRMEQAHPVRYVNDTGCGNTLDADSPVVQRLVVDSLRYWARDMGVDGFRFDLAPVLGRHAGGFSREHPLLDAISSDPVLSARKLIAEPWDPGPGGYRLGGFGAPFAEWNDHFRDSARRFWRGDDGQSGDLARGLSGSADLFEASGRGPSSSINLVTAHDGFTLADVASYTERRNEANGENNRDGHRHNYSVNFGIEGPTDDADILAARRRHRLNLLATLFVSQGTPMLLAGDEFGHSQAGNNNAYAQDNETAWLDWNRFGEEPAFHAAVRDLIRLRRDCPLLRLDRYVHGELADPPFRLTREWFNPDGTQRVGDQWRHGHAFGKLLLRHDEEAAVAGVATLLNAWTGDVDFRLPDTAAALSWAVAFQSSRAVVRVEQRTAELHVKVPAMSLVLLLESGSARGSGRIA